MIISFIRLYPLLVSAERRSVFNQHSIDLYVMVCDEPKWVTLVDSSAVVFLCKSTSLNIKIKSARLLRLNHPTAYYQVFFPPPPPFPCFLSVCLFVCLSLLSSLIHLFHFYLLLFLVCRKVFLTGFFTLLWESLEFTFAPRSFIYVAQRRSLRTLESIPCCFATMHATHRVSYKYSSLQHRFEKQIYT